MRSVIAFVLVATALASALQAAEVTSRKIVYRESVFDQFSESINEHTANAVATDKSPLLPGSTATFENYSGYSRGLNCIAIEGVDDLTVDDVTIKVGNDNTPSGWTAGPVPAVAEHDGTFYLSWDDNLIRTKWVQITIAANGTTGLASTDVFYFGSAPGESGNSTSDAMVTSADSVGATNNPHTPMDPAAIDDRYDYNRDGLVNSADALFPINNATGIFSSLKLITIP